MMNISTTVKHTPVITNLVTTNLSLTTNKLTNLSTLNPRLSLPNSMTWGQNLNLLSTITSEELNNTNLSTLLSKIFLPIINYFDKALHIENPTRYLKNFISDPPFLNSDIPSNFQLKLEKLITNFEKHISLELSSKIKSSINIENQSSNDQTFSSIISSKIFSLPQQAFVNPNPPSQKILRALFGKNDLIPYDTRSKNPTFVPSKKLPQKPFTKDKGLLSSLIKHLIKLGKKFIKAT